MAAIERVLLLTDVVESTRLTATLGDRLAGEIWVSHDRLARDLAQRWGGREVDRTDGFLLLFDHAQDAARWAVAFHEGLAEITRRTGLPVEARVGIHKGAVLLLENAPEDMARGAKPLEVEGLAKPIAARVTAVARGGQTLLTAAAAAELSGDLGAIPMGTWALKGVPEPLTLYALPQTTPAPPLEDSDKAWRVVRQDDLWLPARSVPHNLPAERDRFVGREDELRALATRYASEARLVTLVGPGGTGKTRLSRRYGWLSLGAWPGGVWFCDLGEAHSPAEVGAAVARALGVPILAGDPCLQVARALASRPRCLLLLDNYEQAVDAAPATVGAWLDEAPEARFLVTTRELLRISGEHALALEPLGTDGAALALFAERAREHRPEFAITDQNRADVEELVRQLDGLPLAIELAAARLRALSVSQIVARLGDRFRLLVGLRGASRRHATLAATLDSSWELLTPWEQAAFAALSVFEGSFDLEALEAVLELPEDAPMAVDVLQALVDKSLVRPQHEDGSPRYSMLVTVRAYAAGRLAGAEAQVRDRHCAWFAARGEALRREVLARGDALAYLQLMQLRGDLRAATAHAVRAGNGAAAATTLRALWQIILVQGPYAEITSLAEAVCALPALAPEDRVMALFVLAEQRHFVGQIEAALGPMEEALGLARGLRDTTRAQPIFALAGNLYRAAGRPDQALDALREAVALARRGGDPAMEARARLALATLLVDQGALPLATDAFREALELARRARHPRIEAVAAGNLGAVLLDRGRLGEARPLLQEALERATALGDLRLQSVYDGRLAHLALDEGALEEAALRGERALSEARRLGDRASAAWWLGFAGQVHAANGSVAEARAAFQEALALARALGHPRLVARWLWADADEAISAGEPAEAVLAEAELSAGQDPGLLGLIALSRARAAIALKDAATAASHLAAAEGRFSLADMSLRLAEVWIEAAHVALLSGDPRRAGEELGRAEGLASELGVGPDAPLRRRMATMPLFVVPRWEAG